MSKVIIGIHGLGNKPDKDTLGKWWISSIREGLKSIGKYVFPVKFEMVYWADILYDQPLDPYITDKSNPCYLEERYTPSPINFEPRPHKIRQKVLDLLEKQLDKILLNEDPSLSLDYVTDIIIHKYFRDLETYYNSDKTSIESHARDQIRNRLYEVLKRNRKNDIMLIAHSMGSIVAYDVLTIFKPEFKIKTFVTMGSPLGLPIVMKKISLEQKIELNSGNKLQTPPGVQKAWYNFSDLEDKVALNYNLGDDYDPNRLGINAVDFIVNNNYTINEVNNPHKSYGYLRTPEFANKAYEFFTDGKARTTKWLYGVYNKVYKRVSVIKLSSSGE